MTIDPAIARIVRDAIWLPDRFDPGHDAVHFRRVPRDVHRAATFLTDEYLPAATPVVVRRRDAMAAGAAVAPVHFIFHSAYCCSTLLARAFDSDGVSMGLKEPVILNDLVGWQHRGGTAAAIASVLDDALALLARPFGAGEAVVIKPSNVANGMAPAMLTMRPAARALLIHAPLRTYLASIAGKGMWGRLWVRDLLVKQLREGLHRFGFSSEDYLGQTDLQAGAIGWLAQHAMFAGMVEQFSGRVRTLDSETLMADPATAMVALAEFFGLPLDVPGVVAGPAFTRHSKSGEDFGAAARAEAGRAAADLHADEIEKVAVWAETVAAHAGVPMVLPGAVMG